LSTGLLGRRQHDRIDQKQSKPNQSYSGSASMLNHFSLSADVSRASTVEIRDPVEISYEELRRGQLGIFATGFMVTMSSAVLAGGDSLLGGGISSRRVGRCMLHPDTIQRVAWTMVGVLLMFLDAFLLSLSVFSPGRFGAVEVVDTTYWTIDVALSFFIGVPTADGVDFRRSFIARNYVMGGWFFIDLGLVVYQWSSVAVVVEADGIGSLRYLRFGKYLKLLRLAKFSRSLRLLFRHMHHEYTRLVVKMWACFLAMACWVQLSASGWYLLGSHDDGWACQVEEFSTWPTNYVVSLNWAASQLQAM